jgi:hypothetical protein
VPSGPRFADGIARILPHSLAEVGGEFHELEAKREKAKKRAKGKAEGRST